ncbi:MAG: hypothetical protein ACR2LV_00165 [Solirubrobacteraceae bacterium]
MALVPASAADVVAGAVLLVAVLLIVLALVFYLVSTILALRKITAGLDVVIDGVGEIVQKSAPVNDVVTTINQQLDAGVELLEGLLVKKAGMQDAVGLVDGLYPGSGAAGFRKFPQSRTTRAPRISEVYTKGTLTLARLGREAPIAAASPQGPALRDVARGSSAARELYPEGRPAGARSLPGSPVIGTGAPVQYEPRAQTPPSEHARRPAGAGPQAGAPAGVPRSSGPTSTPPSAAAPETKVIRWKRG